MSWWCKYLSSLHFVNITFLVSHSFDLGRDKRDNGEQIDYDCEFSIWIRLILTWCRCNIAGLTVSSSPSTCQKQSHERAKRQGILLSIPLRFLDDTWRQKCVLDCLHAGNSEMGARPGSFLTWNWIFTEKKWTKSWEPMHKKNEGLTKQHCDKQ